MAAGRKTGGRKKGTPNKLAGNVRDNVLAVFEKLGGVDAMTKWAEQKPTDFYLIYSKLLPKDVNVDATVRLEDIVAGGDDPNNEDNTSE